VPIFQIEEADAFARVMALGRTAEQTAQLFGKTVELVQMRVALLSLREDIQHLVAHGQIPRAVALELTKLGPNEQGEVLRKLQEGAFKNDDDAWRYAECRLHAAVAGVAVRGAAGR
jgi:hypothetical protein